MWKHWLTMTSSKESFIWFYVSQVNNKERVPIEIWILRENEWQTETDWGRGRGGGGAWKADKQTDG